MSINEDNNNQNNNSTSNFNINENIVVAMSGGVDSSVAALLLKQENANIIGVSMQVWDYRKNGGCDSKATCCSPDDFTDARKVAAGIGIPYYVFDMEEKFKEDVINKFVDSYFEGITPNPCVECNNKVKFLELRQRAEKLGFKYVATGHYAQIKKHAQIKKNKTEVTYHLTRSTDLAKDQSYFLYGLKTEELPYTLFPVGHLTKPEVRQIAANHGLSTASKPESQDICFVSGNVQDFLVKLGKKPPIAGEIKNRVGQVLGKHTGIHNFTVGQRKGLQIGGTENPLYVLEINKKENTVIVGEKSELQSANFHVVEVNWVNSNFQKKLLAAKEGLEVIGQLRYRHEGCKVKVMAIEKDSSCTSVYCEFINENDWAVVSPGQIAVFYDVETNQEVLGGGKIVKN